MWDFAYVYDRLTALGEKKQKHKFMKDAQEQFREEQHLSTQDLHVKEKED